MPSEVSFTHYLERARLAIWLVVVVSLIMSFMLVWRSAVKEASESAFLLASQRIVERASYYKQQWLLADQKARLTIEGQSLNYSGLGWVKPLNEQGEIDCLLWLNVLYPEREILGSQPISIDNISMGDGYHCNYLYNGDRLLSIRLKDNRFVAEADFLSN